MLNENKITDIPVWEKMNLTVKEAAEYSNIGENTLRDYIKSNPESVFILWIGKKTLVKRKELEELDKNKFVESIKKILPRKKERICDYF